jgi:CRISPR/Cas system CSM-associated protein Csm2 small subunit
MQVIQEKKGTTIRFNRKLKKTQVEKLLDMIEWQDAISNSKASEKAINVVAELAKATTWKKYGKSLLH